MTLRDFFGASEFMKVVLILWLVSMCFVLFLLNRIDYIVHHDLYNHSLQFSLLWATPYWAFFRLIYVCLVLPAILSAIALASGFPWKHRDAKSIPKSETRTNKTKVQSPKENSMLISCPSCRKTFSKPLVMLDFGNGKGKLVNVCPYCNVKLGTEEKGKRNVEIGVIEMDKEKTKVRAKKRS